MIGESNKLVMGRIKSFYFNDGAGSLLTVSANVLNRGGANGAGDVGKSLDAGEAKFGY